MQGTDIIVSSCKTLIVLGCIPYQFNEANQWYAAVAIAVSYTLMLLPLAASSLGLIRHKAYGESVDTIEARYPFFRAGPNQRLGDVLYVERKASLVDDEGNSSLADVESKDDMLSCVVGRETEDDRYGAVFDVEIIDIEDDLLGRVARCGTEHDHDGLSFPMEDGQHAEEDEHQFGEEYLSLGDVSALAAVTQGPVKLQELVFSFFKVSVVYQISNSSTRSQN